MSGGGGSSGQVYYANQDKLFGTQADIAENMYNEYARRAPTYLDNSSSMTNEAMSGALATRARNQAGADASAAMGQGLQAAARNTARYGAEYNPNRMNQMNQDAAIQGAAMKSSAMNSAEQWAEDQKWNRNAGAYGQIAGMGSGAMEGMGSAGRGYGGMAAQANQNDQANAAGMGVAGGYVGKAVFAAKGGHVRKTKDGAICLATGGLAPVNWRAQPTSGGGMKKSGGVGQFLAGMAPSALSYGIKESGIGKDIAGGLKDAWGGIKNAIVGPQTTELPMGTLTDIAPAGLDAASAAGADATTTAIGEEVGGIAGDAALTGAATTAAEAAALETAGLAAAEAGLGAFGSAAAGSVVPGIGTAIGAGIGALASLWGDGMADGGSVKRKDMTAGGEVDGPGTETSDDIPAWLSDNEYVLNAEAVKMIGVDTLDAINQKGLEVRESKQGNRRPAGIETARKTGLKLASGGNIGIALGSAAKTLMALDEQDQRKELIQIQKDNAARTAEEFGWKRAERAEADAMKQAMSDASKPLSETSFVADGKSFATKQAADGAAAESYNQNAQAIGQEVGGVTGAEIEGARPAVTSETKTTTPTQSQVLGRAKDWLAQRGYGVQAATVQGFYDKARKEEFKTALEESMLNGDVDGLNRALANAGHKAVVERDEGGYTIGGQRFKTPYEMTAALHTMVNGNPMDYLKLTSNNEAKAAQMEARQAQFEKMQQYRDQTLLAKYELAANKGSGRGSSSRSGGGSSDSDDGDKYITNLMKDAFGKDEVFEATDPKDPKKTIQVQQSDVFLRANQYVRDLTQSNPGMNKAEAVVMAKDLAKEKLGIEPAQYRTEVGVDDLGNISVGVVDKKTGTSAGRLHPMVRDYRAVLSDAQYKDAVLRKTEAVLGMPGDKGQLTEDRITEFYKLSNGIAPDGAPAGIQIDPAKARANMVRVAMQNNGMTQQQAEAFINNYARHSALWVQENAAKKKAAADAANKPKTQAVFTPSAPGTPTIAGFVADRAGAAWDAVKEINENHPVGRAVKGGVDYIGKQLPALY